MKRIKDGGVDEGKYIYLDHQKKLTKIVSYATEIRVQHNFLENRLLELEGAIQDNLHYIEFSDLDIQRSYKVLKKLQELRIERRLIKNELEECEIAVDAIKSIDLILPNINNGVSKIQLLKNKRDVKVYYVRSKDNLVFDDFEKQSENYTKKLSNLISVK